MPSLHTLTTLLLLPLLTLTPAALAQGNRPVSSSSSPPFPTAPRTTPTTSAASTSSLVSDGGPPPDVLLNVPNLSVGRIELNVDNLRADINLNANVASLVSINAGVALSVQNINLTIADVQAQLDLVVRLGHLVDIVNRVFTSLDQHPELLTGVLGTLGNATQSALGSVVGAVDGLLGTVTQGGTTLSFLVDNLGNIVQQVSGAAAGTTTSTIVGNYLQNMTDTGVSQTLQGGLTQKTYRYDALNALVDVVTNAAGQVVQATVQKAGSATGGAAGGVVSGVSSVVAGATSAVSSAVGQATGAVGNSTASI